MCACRTATRRRRQFAKGYKHISKAKRPHYSRLDSGVSARRLAARIATEHRIRQSSKK